MVRNRLAGTKMDYIRKATEKEEYRASVGKIWVYDDGVVKGIFVYTERPAMKSIRSI